VNFGRDEDAVAAATDELEQHPSVEARGMQMPGMTQIVATILWVIAAICVIGGIVTLIRGRCSTACPDHRRSGDRPGSVSVASAELLSC
jgi:hypothetical protein